MDESEPGSRDDHVWEDYGKEISDINRSTLLMNSAHIKFKLHESFEIWRETWYVV